MRETRSCMRLCVYVCMQSFIARPKKRPEKDDLILRGVTAFRVDIGAAFA